MYKPLNQAYTLNSLALIIPLMAILIILVIFALANTSDVINSILTVLNVALIEDAAPFKPVSYIWILLKVFISVALLYFIFINYSIILAIIDYYFSKTLAGDIFHRKYSLLNIIFRVLSWNFYRIFYIFSPIFVIGGISLVLFLFTMVFFNILLLVAGISLRFSTFVISFILSVLAFASIISLFLPLWHTAMSSFGVEIAVTEPDLDNKTIKNRSKKLMFVDLKSMGLQALFFLFAVFVAIQFAGGVINRDSISYIGLLNIIALIFFDMSVLIGLEYLKINLYVTSLLYQYEKILYRDKNLIYNL